MCLALSAFGESSHDLYTDDVLQFHTCDWPVYVQAMFLVLYAIVFFNREILFYCSYTQLLKQEIHYMVMTIYIHLHYNSFVSKLLVYGFIFYFRPAYKYLHHMCLCCNC